MTFDLEQHQDDGLRQDWDALPYWARPATIEDTIRISYQRWKPEDARYAIGLIDELKVHGKAYVISRKQQDAVRDRIAALLRSVRAIAPHGELMSWVQGHFKDYFSYRTADRWMAKLDKADADAAKFDNVSNCTAPPVPPPPRRKPDPAPRLIRLLQAFLPEDVFYEFAELFPLCMMTRLEAQISKTLHPAEGYEKRQAKLLRYYHEPHLIDFTTPNQIRGVGMQLILELSTKKNAKARSRYGERSSMWELGGSGR